MTLTDFITRVNYAFRGTDDDAPTVGDDDWTYWTSIANRKKDEWADDPTQVWSSLYENRKLNDAITATATPSYDLPTDFIMPANRIYALTTAGQYVYYDIIEPQEANTTTQQGYIAGRNPQKLYLTAEITSTDQIVGGDLYMPAYYRPADIDDTSESSVIPVDDPNWLVMATAAELAANDLTYEDKATDLYDKATSLYRQMTHKNRRGTRHQPRKVPTLVSRIVGTARNGY